MDSIKPEHLSQLSRRQQEVIRAALAGGRLPTRADLATAARALGIGDATARHHYEAGMARIAELMLGLRADPVPVRPWHPIEEVAHLSVRARGRLVKMGLLDPDEILRMPPDELRSRLLAARGVGPAIAGEILAWAADHLGC